MQEWLYDSLLTNPGRQNATFNGYITYGDPSGLVAPQTPPLRPTFPSFGLARAGVPVGGTATLLSAWFPSLDTNSAFDIGWSVVSVTDVAPNIAQIKIGTFDPNPGQFINTIVNGDEISLIANDGGGTFYLAGQSSVGINRQGALVSYRFAIGTNGSSALYPSFGGPAAGPMFMLVEAATEPVGNPTGPGFNAIWAWYHRASNTLKIKFPDGNLATIPSVEGPVQATVVALPAFVAGNSAPADIVMNGLYDIPVTAANSTVTLPSAAVSGKLAHFSADGVKNAHTITFVDETGAVVLTAAAPASKRFVATAIKIGTTWRVDLGASSP